MNEKLTFLQFPCNISHYVTLFLSLYVTFDLNGYFSMDTETNDTHLNSSVKLIVTKTYLQLIANEKYLVTLIFN